MPHRALVAEQPELANEAQDIVGERGAGHDQAVHLEVFRGEPLQIHVRLEFAVELLAGAVVLVEGDDLLGRQLQGGPPAFQLDVGLQQELPLLVDGAFDDADNPTTGDLPFCAGLVGPLMGVPDTEQGHPFARPRFADLPFGNEQSAGRC